MLRFRPGFHNNLWQMPGMANASFAPGIGFLCMELFKLRFVFWLIGHNEHTHFYFFFLFVNCWFLVIDLYWCLLISEVNLYWCLVDLATLRGLVPLNRSSNKYLFIYSNKKDWLWSLNLRNYYCLLQINYIPSVEVWNRKLHVCCLKMIKNILFKVKPIARYPLWIPSQKNGCSFETNQSLGHFRTFS